jgi:hypothetical protein
MLNTGTAGGCLCPGCTTAGRCCASMGGACSTDTDCCTYDDLNPDNAIACTAGVCCLSNTNAVCSSSSQCCQGLTCSSYFDPDDGITYNACQ